MRIIAIGDVHGLDRWKNIVSGSTYDTVVFMGDYFDTHENISAEKQKINFRELIRFKNQNKEKVILLTGNHDYHYLDGIDETYSGFQRFHKMEFQELLHKAIDDNLMQICYVYEKFLFSHAGVTKTWCKNVFGNVKFENKELESAINNIFKTKPLEFRFTMGSNYSVFGDDKCQSPIWVRPRSLQNDKIEGITQIVGHTRQSRIELNPDVVIIDTLGTSGEYLVIEDGKMIIAKTGN